MFTGLVRAMGVIHDIGVFGKGRRFAIDLGALAGTLYVGQSVAVNGACLTATNLSESRGTFEAVAETVARTNLGMLKPGDKVNLEPALKAGDALDGHIMLGHVDVLGRVVQIDASSPDCRIVKISLPENIRHLVADKGSVAIDGISLTVVEAGDDWFTVSIIPHTWENCTLSLRRPGDGVNLEADVLARYADRILRYGRLAGGGGITESFLRDNGFT